MTHQRTAAVRRSTNETKIEVRLNLDGQGNRDITTELGFFDHLLAAWAKHSFFDLWVKAEGDLHIDGHHMVEDTGIVLGQAFAKAYGDGRGAARFGHSLLPMDEALVEAAVDISGRPFLSIALNCPQAQVGSFDSCLFEEFLRGFVTQAGITLHLRQLAGSNSHHILEAAVKALGRALSQAAALDPRIVGVHSTKGFLQLGRDAEENQ